jgi:hypothetical protein
VGVHMAEPMDPETLAKFLRVLELGGRLDADGWISFNARSQDWIRDNLEADPREVAQAMAANGNRVKRYKNRGDSKVWQNEFYEVLRFPWRGGQTLYVEMIFNDCDRDAEGCYIDVVNVKWA